MPSLVQFRIVSTKGKNPENDNRKQTNNIEIIRIHMCICMCIDFYGHDHVCIQLCMGVSMCVHKFASIDAGI